MYSDPFFEVCLASDVAELTDNLRSLAELDVQRIELCSAMDVGGLTPSDESIALTKKLCPNIRLMVMIRSRAGDFVYDDDELAIMQQQIQMAAENGADGVVFGTLTADDELDLPALSQLCQSAQSLNLDITFHRAFDGLISPARAISVLVEHGVSRILSAGIAFQQPGNVLDGLKTMESYIELAAQQLEIIVSGSINRSNVIEVVKQLKGQPQQYSVHSFSGVLTDNRIDIDKLNSITTTLRAG